MPVKIRGLNTSFGFRGERIQAVDNVDLDIADGEFFVLLGPSGCGKTTMLRSIAGLERPSAGFVSIDGEVVFSASDGIFVPPENRSIAMVFQSYAIWPHMDVYENVAFPLREGVRRLPKIEVKRRVSEVLELLGMAEMSDRPVTTLSGGQQQRVALARALALRPFPGAQARVSSALTAKSFSPRATVYLFHPRIDPLPWFFSPMPSGRIWTYMKM